MTQSLGNMLVSAAKQDYGLEYEKYGKTTYRDCLGRTQGTKTVDRNGKTTWRDASGRIQGTATTDRNGKTTYRDGSGRLIGTRKVR